MKEVIKSASTYILPDDRAQTRDPQNALARHAVDEEALAREHGLAEALGLVLPDHALRRGEKGVLADGPLLVPGHADAGDVAEGGRGEEQFARAGEGRA